MRIYLLTFFFIVCAFQSQAQTTADTSKIKKNDSLIVIFCEIMPTFQNAEYQDFDDYILKNMVFPTDAKKLRITGNVFVAFIIEKDGSVSNVKVVEGRGLHPSCDNEAIRLILSAPNWNPGMHNGKIIRVRVIKKIPFYQTNSKDRVKMK